MSLDLFLWVVLRCLSFSLFLSHDVGVGGNIRDMAFPTRLVPIIYLQSVLLDVSYRTRLVWPPMTSYSTFPSFHLTTTILLINDFPQLYYMHLAHCPIIKQQGKQGKVTRKTNQQESITKYSQYNTKITEFLGQLSCDRYCTLPTHRYRYWTYIVAILPNSSKTQPETSIYDR